MKTDFDVAIVGCGPVGATLANLLGREGLSVAVFEREAAVHHLPRAIHFDGETLRIFRMAGVGEAVSCASRPTSKGMHFVNAAGKTLLIRKGIEGPGPHACFDNHYFHQPDLEKAIRSGFERLPNVRVFYRHDVFAIAEQAGGAEVQAEDMASGSLRRIRASYVVGCDGARSLVRRLIGSTFEDLGLHQPWLVVDVAMRRPVDLPDYTVQHCDPARPMTACYVSGRRRRWEIMLLPDDDPAAVTRAERVWEFLSRWITPGDAEIERAAVYTFHSVIARTWRLGRLLIAGDAAHQTPPFLGQGMCAGIRDAANLYWKLAMVLRGRAAPSLLDTYGSEREPHVRAFIDLAVRLGNVIQTTDPEIAEARDRRFREGDPTIFSYPTPALGPGIVDDAPPPAGVVFPQPRLDDGRLLDEALGGQFAVLGERTVLDAAGGEATRRWRAIGAAVLADPGSEVASWLSEYAVRAVVLRPDRYVMGTARDAAELERLSLRLPLLESCAARA